MYHANVNVNLIMENVNLVKIEITINVGVNVKIQKTIVSAKKIVWNPATCSCENSKYVRIIIMIQ